MAVVTGSSRGIGRAVAVALAGLGCDIAVTYRERRQSAEEVVEQIRSLGRKSFAYQLEAAEPDGFTELRTEVERDLGPAAILVNNAGTILRPGEWDVQEPEEIRRTLAVDLESVIHGMRAFSPPMVESGWGRIVNITTTYSFNGAAPVLSYTAAKAGVNTVTRAMAAELGPQGVLVNAVAPGNIDTELTRSAGEDLVQWSVDTTPLGRLGTVEEVAEAVTFLVRTTFICGEIIAVDGGQLLKI
ncbi:SDR family oxidoreductase [Streptomyces sp. HNM0663]|uniref:SDR family oxidoreductase n=1 Tax=Streptomyces chengmaiensis TaxID=3040919 RepID=A0ABT6HFR8_9ACTN|nr:SDR family oxidoreductase [Streptomyces chengmaiensis]MDH2387426.1 SDR family oxidoreductase [Streptomyces chengmaiensis]